MLITVAALYAFPYSGPCARWPVLASAAAAVADQQQAANVFSGAFNLMCDLTFQLLPGATLAMLVFIGYNQREQLTRKSRVALFLGILSLVAVLWARQVKMTSQSPQVGKAMVQIPKPHSGEVVCSKDGDCISLPDPSKPEGAVVEPGWQRALAAALTDAIKGGRDQVVLVFSRQGCPWCERQVPVLQRAILSRAKVVEEAAVAGVDSGTAFVGGGEVGHSMVSAPLRVFVLDAGEFPHTFQQFRIEAFPTTMFWGQPGAVPLVAQGYLDDAQIEEYLHEAAIAQPQPSGGRRKRKGLFGLFR